MFKDCDSHMPRKEGLAIDGLIQNLEKIIQDENGRVIIEAIRRDEFVLDLEIGCNESLLKKKKTCLSDSCIIMTFTRVIFQYSHFLLELFQMQMIILILVMWNQLWHLSCKALVLRS